MLRIDPREALERGTAILASQPFSVHIGVELTELSADGAWLELSLQPSHLQQHGFAHGGVVSFLADNALAFAGGIWLHGRIVTSEFKINFIQPAVGEQLVAWAYTVSRGRTQAVVRCDVFSVSEGEKKLCAVAQGTISGSEPRMREAQA